MKKFLLIFISAVLAFLLPFSAFATETENIYPYDACIEPFWAATADILNTKGAKALCLMEASTGKIVFCENADEKLPIASVTKVTTMLLVVEALDNRTIKPEDEVTVSAHAASMGGSQIFLKENEKMSVHDLLKSVAVASANDATVALGEYICGSEEAFIAEMNRRAAELGCNSTHYSNTNGLPDENHYSSARDVAIITRELMGHKRIYEYTKIWMDTVRGGEFGLANTNKLLRFYKGATGMKTGYTGEAGYCISATAEREGVSLIAVVLGGETSGRRFELAKTLLDTGFASFKKVTAPAPDIEDLKIIGGKKGNVALKTENADIVVEKSLKGDVTAKINLPEYKEAPIKAGEVLGETVYYIGETEICRKEIKAAEDIEKATFFSVFCDILRCIFNSL